MKIKEIKNKSVKMAALRYAQKTYYNNTDKRVLLEMDLLTAFIFANTIEGHLYWYRMYLLNKVKAK